MNAKQIPGAGYHRRELGTCLPLKTPLSLHIFPAHVCNFKCSYCLHSLPPGKLLKKGFKKSLLDFSLFSKLVNDATAFSERFKVLILAGWGEPLIHPQIAEMVEYAKRKKIAERIEVVSNGLLLNREMSRALVKAGIDRIRISIQGLDSKKCLEMAGVEIDYDVLMRNIEYFFAHREKAKLFVKTVDAALPAKADREMFCARFGNISDEIAIEQVIPAIRDIDYSKFHSKFSKRHCGGNADRVSVCPFPFYMSVVHPDGNYAPCCMPYLPVDFGNVGDTAITAIWKGEVLRRFRIAHLKGEKGGTSVCRSCLSPQYDIQRGDNLDRHAEVLLPLYRTENDKKENT